MRLIENQCFDEERALYGSDGINVKNCRFEGAADGESALKESRNIIVDGCYWNLRYPFWHDRGLEITDTTLTENCRAALWYSEDIKIKHSRLHGIKALRECSNVVLEDCDIVSPEFGWSVKNIQMIKSSVQSEYFMLRSAELNFKDTELKGKYSFQYIEDAVFENCVFDTKDAFWHGKNVIVRNSVIKGEYLAWYSDNLTLENCKIIGTQPFCYCKGLKLINCEMQDTDLCFEKSEVEATIITPVISIKNPAAGYIKVPEVTEIIKDSPDFKGEIIITGRKGE